MGKVRTRILGLDDVEEKQKKKQKQKLEEKKIEKKKVTKNVILNDSEGSLANASSSDKLRDSSPEAQNDKSKEKKKSQKKQEATKKVRGKKYIKAKEAVTQDKKYSLDEAIKLLKKITYVKFDESVEIHANLVKEGMRGEVDFPHSIGKTMRIRIVDEKLLEEVEAGKVEFEMLVSHPSYMPKLARFAKILGPRGLMPTPKAGTVTDKPEEVVKKFTSGAVRYKGEAKAPLLHQLIGKISYEDKQIEDNVKALIKTVGLANVQKLWIKTSMSPSILLDAEKI